MSPSQKHSKSLSLFVATFLIFCSTVSASYPDAQTDGIGAAISWSQNRIQDAERSHGFGHYPSPDTWVSQIVYSIQVDRFNNGDPSNDLLNIEPAQANGDLRGILDFRHGGDLKGITQRLDYLKDLGVTSLWLTPFLKHNGSYHGYCTTDPTVVDPGFGSNKDFKELVAQAHRRGIRVIMDVVVNHLCDPQTDYGVQADHYQCANELDAKNWEGRSGGSSAQGTLQFSDKFFGPLKSQHFFNRCGPNSQSDMEGTGPAAVYGDFVRGMFDYDTRNRDFQKIFTNIFKHWIADTDVDGFRLDAAKHVSEDFVAAFSTDIRAYAASIGKKNFYIVGEVAGPSDWIARRLGTMYTNPANPNDRGNVPKTLTQRIWELMPVYQTNPAAPYPGLNGAYDFTHGGLALDVLGNHRPPSALEDHFRGGYYNDLAHQNDYRLNWNLLEIHDWPRFNSRHKNKMEKSILGLGYLAFAEGSPIIYYGAEQGFNGDCHHETMNVGPLRQEIINQCGGHSHALFRQDMFMGGMSRLGSTVPEISRLSYIGPAQGRSANEADPFVNREHAVYKSTRKFLQIRNSCKSLKYGTTTFRWTESQRNEGILAFSRIDKSGGDTYEALVILNTGYSAMSLPEMKVADNSQGKKWKNLLNASEYARTTGNGSVSFAGLQIQPNSMMVLVPEDNVTEHNEYLETRLCVQ